MSEQAQRVQRGKLSVNHQLDTLIEEEILPSIGISVNAFWLGFATIIANLGNKNRALLAKREDLQNKIDEWNKAQNSTQNLNQNNTAQYESFLRDIGYIVPEGEDFSIETSRIDKEIATVAGPQLVVPASNARFCLNAANARWGSLFSALYSTDALDNALGIQTSKPYNPQRGKQVLAVGVTFLDQAIPLKQGQHQQVTSYDIDHLHQKSRLTMQLQDGTTTTLQDEKSWIAYSEDTDSQKLLFINNNLHIECTIKKGKHNLSIAQSGMSNILLEAAISTIIDLEDSVATVDAEDKTIVYKNWLGLIKGNLKATVKNKTRALNTDKTYTSLTGKPLTIPGRSLLLVRTVGHLMTTDAVLDENGQQVPEGMLDALVTVACSVHDIKGNSHYQNSRAGSIYIVKPKMHGPEEAALTHELFNHVENILGLEANTVKIGLMDEERRTSVNLKECIRALKTRLFFINTGFLDRTGDEIHTSMDTGAILPKATIKQQKWITTYEDRNVTIGLQCGLKGRAQIGKGMWAMPDKMYDMLASKAAQLQQGASCAWVPSPLAAVLHATHYHAVRVSDVQDSLKSRPCGSISDLLTPMLLGATQLSPETIQSELNNNAQGLLGYVVRWINQGIGCSKVPDINNIGLMEDRATLRISSQHITNWLVHGICTKQQVIDTLEKMAVIVDAQNSADPYYTPMAPDTKNSIAFKAASDLIFLGTTQPNGYTEPLLHHYRRQYKATQSL